MPYVDGFLLAVHKDKRDAYKALAEKAAKVFKKHGALAVAECWGDDVPEGKTTSIPMAVKIEEGEVPLFSWIVWPSKEARDTGNKKVMNDPELDGDPADMPFDGMRMMFGGFEVLGANDGAAQEVPTGYVDGFIAAVPKDKRSEFMAFTDAMSKVMADYGVKTAVDCWGDDVPEGRVTSFPMAVKAGEDEVVAFSWMLWPSKDARSEGMAKAMQDPRMAPNSIPMPFDGSRVIHGGFEILMAE